MKIDLLSPAKINLFLLITGRRDDGYHYIQTLFQLLDYGDRMQFELRSDDKIVLTDNLDGIKAEQNLIFRAAKLLSDFLKQKKISHSGAQISIDKVLPMGAGLGGGSSNAATTLLALNYLWQANLSIPELTQIGLQLGADVPVFVEGNSAFAKGIGEQLRATEITSAWYLVLNPQVAISTAEIFSNPELTRDSSAIKIPALAAGCVRNDCQNVVEKLYPEVAKARLWLDQFGKARLTGTGACLFIEFENELDAQNVFQQIPSDWNGFVAKGVNKSPAHTKLEQFSQF